MASRPSCCVICARDREGRAAYAVACKYWDDALCAGAAGGCTLCDALVMLHMLEVLEVIRRVLFCMLEVVEGDRCLPELLEVVRLVIEIMLCVL